MANAREMIEVAAGILADANGRVLLMRRLSGTHLAGLWEFPGGKIEAGEGIEQALRRELREELGIETHAFAPLISLPWRYPEKSIRLHALRVTEWNGTIHAREGHPLRWLSPDRIDADGMPPADRPVLNALLLPPHYAITPKDADNEALRVFVDAALSRGEKLIQLRLPGRERGMIRDIAIDLAARCRQVGTGVLINGDIELARELGLGVHLRAAQLDGLSARPLSHEVWVGASCHDPGELERAAVIGADFATLSPVRATASHPGVTPLGWERFARLAADVPLPVYALGGVGPDDLDAARAAGAQGVAGISAFLAPS